MGTNIMFGNYKPLTKDANDFDIKVELEKDEKGFLPLGIVNFKGKVENNVLRFKITITGKGVNHWELSIKSYEEIIYTALSNTDEIEPVTISAKSSNKTRADNNKDRDMVSSEQQRFWPAGEYIFEWDGFDKNGLYMSKRMLMNHLTVSIIGKAEGQQKEYTSESLQFVRSEVDWIDIIVDKSKKRIDVYLRVNLKDGGAKGFDKHMAPDSGTYPATKYKDEYEWEKIPKETIKKYGKEPIKSRTKSFEELKNLTLNGLIYYWGRNRNHSEGKCVTINSNLYEIFVYAEDTKENSQNEVKLVYNTNNAWERSGNPGMLGKIAYNVGYIEYSNGWGYQTENDEDEDFSFTSAHEIGHQILKAFGNFVYSWQHRGSSYMLPQDEKPTPDNSAILKAWKNSTHLDYMPSTSGEYYPQKGEIDLMKYYHYEKDAATGRSIYVPLRYKRSIATEKDVCGLIWLTKIKTQ